MARSGGATHGNEAGLNASRSLAKRLSMGLLRSITSIVLAALALMALTPNSAWTATVGERHLIAHNPTAALRDAEHRDTVRVTVWYPAAADAKEVSLDLGPPGKPLFKVGSAAPDAPFADDQRR